MKNRYFRIAVLALSHSAMLMQPVLAAQAYRHNVFVPGLLVTAPQEAPPVYDGENPEAPSPLTVTPSVQVWADAYVGTKQDRVVTITNSGATPVELQDGHIGGQAFSGSTSACPAVLSPSQSCEATVSFVPREAGKFSGSFDIVAVNYARRSVVLEGSAVGAPLSVAPQRIDMGETNRGVPSTYALAVSNGTAGAAQFALGTVPSGLSATTTCSSLVAPGSTCNVSITVNASTPLGPLALQLPLLINGQTMSIPVTATVNETVMAVSTKTLTFGSVKVGTSQVQSVQLYNYGNVSAPFKSAELIATNSAYTVTHNCPPVIGAGDMCAVQVTYTPPDYSAHAAQLRVAAGNPVTDLTIDVMGQGRAPVLAISPETLDFGSIEPGTSVSRSFQLTNPDVSKAQGIDIKYQGSLPGSVTSDCGTVLEGQRTCLVTVTVSPTSFGTLTGQVKVNYSGQVGLTQATLTGTAPGVVLSAAPASLNFGDLTNGEVSAKTVTVTNLSSAKTTRITSVKASTTAFSAAHSCGDLLPGASCSVNVSFQPSVPGAQSADVIVSQSEGNPTTVPVSGNSLGARLEVTPTSAHMGTVAINAPASSSLTLRNTGNIATTVTSITATGDLLLQGSCSSLAAGASCPLTVKFDSSTPGQYSGTLNIQGNSQNLIVPASLTVGGPALSLSATTLDFGAVDLNSSSQTKSVLVYNTGTKPLTGLTAQVSGATTFSVTHNCSNIASGDSCVVNAVFTPSRAVTSTASVSLTPEGGLPVSLNLIGTGGSQALSFTGETAIGVVAPNSPNPTATTIYNSGTMPVTVQAVSAATGVLSANTCTNGLVLAPLASCGFSFAPNTTTQGTFSQVVSVASTAGTYSRTYTGKVEASSVSLSRSSVDFGAKGVGGITPATIFVQNTGAATTVSAVAVTGTGFSLSTVATESTCGVGASFTMQPNSSCMLTVRFAPTSVASFTGALNLTANGTAQSVALSGSGITESYVISGSAGSNTVPVTSAVVSNNYSVDGSLPTNTFTIWLRGQVALANTVNVSLSGGGYTLTGLAAVSAGNSALTGGATFAETSGVATTNATYYNVRATVQYTGTTLPSRQTGQLNFAVAGGNTYSVNLTTESVAPAGGKWTASYNNSNSVPQPSDLGVISVNTAVDGTVEGSRTTTLAMRNQSPNGKLAGVFTSSDPQVTFTVYKQSATGTLGTVCAAAKSTVSPRCVTDDGGHFYVQLSYAAASLGVFTGSVTFTPDVGSGLAEQVLTWKAEGRNNASSQFATGWAGTFTAAPPTQDMGTYMVAQTVDGTSGSSPGLTFYVRNTGTHGKIAGTFTLEGGDNSFVLSTPMKGYYNTTYFNTPSASCGAVLSSNRQSTSRCVADDPTTGAFQHLQVVAQFKPLTVGQHTAKLVFTPVSGGASATPVSVTLTGIGANNLTYAASTLPGSIVPPTDPVQMGYAAVNQAIDATSSTRSNFVYFVAQGTNKSLASGYGKLAGSVALSGSPAFSLTAWGRANDSGAYQTSGCAMSATIGSLCVADAIGSAAYDNLLTLIQFKPSTIGSHFATLTFTPVDPNLPPYSVTLTGEGRFDAAPAWSTAAAATVAPASVEDFGGTPVNQSVDGSTAPLSKTYYVRNTGTAGKLSGQFSLTGSAAYSITSATLVNSNGTTTGSCVISGDKQSAGPCTAASAEYNSNVGNYVHLALSVQFLPTVTGLHFSDLRFTPAGGTGYPASTIKLRGEGQYNVAYQASSSFSNPSVAVPATLDAGNVAYSGHLGGAVPTVDLPAIYLHQTGTAGKLAGTLSVTGPQAGQFRIASWGSSRPYDGVSTPCSFTNNAASKCVAATASTTSTASDNLWFQVKYTPAGLGVANATITFTPDAATGLVPTSWNLRGTAVYDITYQSSTTSGTTTPPSSPQPIGAGVTYYTTLPTVSAGTITQDIIFRASGQYGQLGGSVSLTGASNITLTGWGTISESGSVSLGCSRTTTSGGACLGAVVDQSTASYKHLVARISYTPTQAGIQDNAALTFTPHPAMGLAPVSLSLTAQGRNDLIGTAEWSGSYGSTTSPGTDFGTMASGTGTYYVTFPASSAYGATQGTISVTGSPNWNIASIRRLNAITGQNQYNGTVVGNAATVPVTEVSVNGRQSLEVVVTYVGTSNSAQSATLTYTPGTGQGAPRTLTLTAAVPAPLARNNGNAVSCYALLLEGQTTSGVYTIQPVGQAASVNVYCDQTTDGGGWTLVMAAPAGTSLTGWNTAAATRDPSVGPKPSAANSFKLADSYINAIPTAGGARYRILSDIPTYGITNQRRFIAARAYSHLTCGSSAIVASYADQASPLYGGSGSSYTYLCGMYHYANSLGDYGYFATNYNGTGTQVGTNIKRQWGAAGTLDMYVR